MFLIIFLCVLVVALVLLGAYSHVHLASWLAPDGAIIQNLIPGLLTMILEITAIGLVASYLIDRKWTATRQHIVNTLKHDYFYFMGFAREMRALGHNSLSGAPTDGLGTLWNGLLHHISANPAQQALQYLTPAFNPEIAELCSEYMLVRFELDFRFRQVGDEQRAVHLAHWILAGRDYSVGSSPTLFHSRSHDCFGRPS